MKLINQIPGTNYTESGKIDIARFFLFLVIGYLISGLIGIGYGLLSDLNPWIYLNFILLGITAFVVIFAASLFKTAGKLRNRYVVMLLAIFFGFICIYNAWSAIYGESAFGGLYFKDSLTDLTRVVSERELSIGKFGRDGTGLGSTVTSIIYVVELLILTLVPAWFLVKDPTYYCEDCDKPMNEKEYFFGLTEEQSKSMESGVKTGKLKELFELQSYEEKKLDLSLKYIQCTSNECPECGTLVYSADLGTAKMGKENSEFNKQEVWVKNVFGTKD